MVYHIFFWVFGLAHSLSWDYLPGVPQGEEAEVRVSWKEKPIGGFLARILLGYESQLPFVKEEKDDNTTDAKVPEAVNDLERRASHLSAATFRSRRQSGHASGAILPAFRSDVEITALPEPAVYELPLEPPKPSTSLLPPGLMRFFRAISVIVTPITLTIAISLPVALIKPLKALFVDTTASGGPSWHGPDGNPPLTFVLDTGTYFSPTITDCSVANLAQLNS